MPKEVTERYRISKYLTVLRLIQFDNATIVAPHMWAYEDQKR